MRLRDASPRSSHGTPDGSACRDNFRPVAPMPPGGPRTRARACEAVPAAFLAAQIATRGRVVRENNIRPD
jgi:hypothetical protein